MSLKILSQNIAYCSGLCGSPFSYATGFYKQLFHFASLQRKAEKQIVDLIKNQEPDVCLFAELTNPSLQRIQSSLQGMYPYAQAATKYGKDSKLQSLPIYKTKCNGVLLQNDHQVIQHDLSHGCKKLVYEISLNDECSVFHVHLALKKQMRLNQLKDLAPLIQRKKYAILTGDFNCFSGFLEFDEFMSITGLIIVSDTNQKTFPSYKPKHTLDVFLCSPEIEVQHCSVIPDMLYSDHLPTILECNLP